MSSLPTDPEDPAARLFADGYDVVVGGGHLTVRRIPYLARLDAGSDAELVVQRDGKLVLPVDDTGAVTVDAVGDHTIWFAGQSPLDERGRPLGVESVRDLGDGETVQHQLSFKPASGYYPNLYDKVRRYAFILRDAARTRDPDVTSTPGAAFQVVEDDLPLVYRDTNTTRAGLTSLNNLFRGHTVGIVGLGGTGSYILDQVAKTWVTRIILIDGDVLENHNAFRAPGAPALDQLQAKPMKVDYFAEQYSRMHTGISVHPEPLDQTNMSWLQDATFVFLAAADATERPAIMAWLKQREIPFIDVGMGLSQGEAGLTGLLKVTAYLPGGSVPLPVSPAVPPGQDDYSTNIQVADLNALNALLAVIEWKRWLGFYDRHEEATEVVYKLFLNELRNGIAE